MSSSPSVSESPVWQQWLLPGLALLLLIAGMSWLVGHVAELVVGLADVSPMTLALVGSLSTGLLTLAGAIPVLTMRRVSHKVEDSLLGFGAGVMMAAAVFSLLIPSLEASEGLGYGAWPAALLAAAGIAVGAAFLMVFERAIPHQHLVSGVMAGGDEARKFRRVWLFIFAITIHNFPEGLAVGVGFASGDVPNALALAMGIGLQNLPEGLVVALAMLTLGYSRWQAMGVTLLTGLVEPLGGLMGGGLVTLSQTLMPWGLAFAAGAMLFVVSHEIIPESHRKGHEHQATIGLMIGFMLMMVLDVALKA